MADSSVRKIEFEPNKHTRIVKKSRIISSPYQVKWTGLEKSLVILGSIIILSMMIFLVSSSISATSAQQELSKIGQSISNKQNNITNVRQEIGELTSNTRLKKIAHEKGLTLIEKNIRTIHQ